MERRALGKSGLTVPAVGLGTWKVFNVKDDAGEARCEAVVSAALEAQANLFDSSPMYGEAERVLALSLAGRRDRAVVATKVWARDRALGEQQIEQALAWFERVDLYQVHNLLGTREHLPYLRHLRHGGRVTAVGATHYLTSELTELARMIDDDEVDAVQVPYHPLERAAEKRLLPAAAHRGAGVVVMSPLGTGSLLRRAPGPVELAPLAAFGVTTWSQALLKWILSDPRVHTVIPATSSPEHMRDNAAAGDPPWFGEDERRYVADLAARFS